MSLFYVICNKSIIKYNYKVVFLFLRVVIYKPRLLCFSGIKYC